LNDQTLDRHYIYNNLYNLSFIKNIKEEKKYHAFTKHFRLILLYAYYKEEPSKFQDRHSRAYELFKKKGDLINAIYHLFFVDKDQAIEEWNINRRKAKDEMDFSFVDSLFEIVESDEIGLAISNTDKALILTKKAHYLRQIGNLNDSQKAYEEALKLYQSNGFTEDVVKTHHGYAVLLALQEKYDDARSRLNTLLQFNPNDTYSINMLASLEVSNNHYERARDLLKKSRQINPENLFVINFSAQIELDTENWKSAIDYLEEANKIFPYETSILQKLAKAYTGRSNALLKQVRSISAKDEVQQHHRKTLIYEFLTFADGGQITEARSTFRKILSLDSSFSDILERWARSEQTKRNYKKASVFYEIYLDYNPRDSKVLFSYGWLKNAKYGRKERYRARELFKKSLEINPKRPEAWFYLGEVERLDKNFNEAANCYREAYTPWEADDGYYISIDGYNGEDDDQYDEIEIDSEDSKMVYKILWHWSKIEYKLGNFDKGRELYKKLHRIAFSHCKCRVLTRWAISEYECQNYEKGDSHLSSAIDCCDNVENQCSTITYLEAELSPLAGKPTAQSQQIARSMAQYSFHKIIGNIVLSRLYRKSNRQEEAKEILNNLLDEFPKNSNLLSEIEHFQGNSINTIN
jgi:tetratricopeptide (TPR) repeat protein